VSSLSLGQDAVLDPSLRASQSAQNDPITPGRREVIGASSKQSQRLGDHLASPRRSETTCDGESDSDTEKGEEQTDDIDHGLVDGAMRGNAHWSEFISMIAWKKGSQMAYRARADTGITCTGN
jgi:hypothetical protein